MAMIKRYIFTLLLLLAGICSITGQTLLSVKGPVELPFEYRNHFIIVNIRFQGVLPLRFIFDTGAENTILTKKEISDFLHLHYEREFRVMGADMEQELIAYLVRGIRMEIGSLLLTQQSILVLDDDYYRFDEFTGLQIHGILGSNILRYFTVQIDYHARKIILYPANSLRQAPSGYCQDSLAVHKNRPFLTTSMVLDQDTILAKLLIDTGASLALLLHAGTHPDIRIPENAFPGNIGAGLGGFLEGYLGRCQNMSLCEFQTPMIPTSFQEITPDMDTSFLHGRHGVIGNRILERFTVILDYPRGRFYLKPARNLRRDFEVDRSGLVAIATGPELNVLFAQFVSPNSPAAECGIQPGDLIRRINGWAAANLDLETLNRLLSRKPGKKIKLVYIRDGEKHSCEFVLRNLY